MSSRIARVIVTFSATDSYTPWHREMWEQTGIISTIEKDGWAHLGESDVLVLVGRGTLTSLQRESVTTWANTKQGTVVCIGSTWGLDNLLGVTTETSPSFFSRAKATDLNGIHAGIEPFVFLGGQRAKSAKATQTARTDEQFVVASNNGSAFYFAPDPGRTLSLIGLGRSVGGDRIGPGDGSVDSEEGEYRADDGCNLEWTDRTEFEGIPVFATPHIDLLREALVRVVIDACRVRKTDLAIAWHWPENAHAATVCSIDWDTSQSDHMRRVISMLAKFGVLATWLGTPAGNPQELYRGLRQWNHDFGLQYKPENGQLKAEQLRIQYVNISRLSSSRTMAACRGHEGYWHGLTSIYEAIEGAGGSVSFAKGGLQKGTTGFTFGTSRPFFPVNRFSKQVPVLEIPYAVYQPGILTPNSFATHAVEVVRELGGCLHFSLCPSGSATPGFEDGMENLLTTLRHHRFTSFLAERIVEFERSRRATRVMIREHTINVISDRPVTGFTIMVAGSQHASAAGRRFTPTSVTRYGTTFTCATFDMEPRSQTNIQFEPTAQAA